MESTVYGHPGATENGADSAACPEKRARLDFGLRSRMMAYGPKPRSSEATGDSPDRGDVGSSLAFSSTMTERSISDFVRESAVEAIPSRAPA